MSKQQPVLCRPVGRLRNPQLSALGPLPAYSGSTKGRCAPCRAEVWIGPRSLEVIDAGLGVPVCIDCVAEALAAGAAGTLISLGNPERPGTNV